MTTCKFLFLHPPSKFKIYNMSHRTNKKQTRAKQKNQSEEHNQNHWEQIWIQNKSKDELRTK